MRQLLLTLFILSLISSCSSSPSPVSFDDENSNDVSTYGTQVQLAYTFTTNLDSDNNGTIDFTALYPDTYTLPVYIKSDGVVHALASDFPEMVYRVCVPSSSFANCDTTYEGLTDLGVEGIDMVIDSCGASKSDTECGGSDDTVYTGTLSSTGDLLLNSVSIRSRAFIVKASGEGYTGSQTDQGMQKLKHLTVRITSGHIATGSLSADGTAVTNSLVTLVTGGIVGSDVPALAGAYFSATMKGSFNTNPLDILK